MEYYSAIKKEENSNVWMNAEPKMLSVLQSQKNK